MKKREKAAKSVDKDLEIVEFMTEFARFLVAGGISRKRFTRIVEYAYFQAASQQARLRNDRLNQSAVAAMTGLTRTQVRSMLKRERSAIHATSDRIDRVIAAWSSDAEYITAAFSPRRLRISGQSPSFATLVQKVGGDIPPRAILRELERQRLVSVNDRYVSLTQIARNEIESRSLRHLSSALYRIIQGAGESRRNAVPVRAVTLELSYPSLSGAGRILMQRRLSKILRALAAEVEAAGAAVALESPATIRSGKKTKSQARVLLLTNEKEY